MNPRDPFGLVGQVLDTQFRVDELVGEGGFSTVYRGHHLGLNEPVAIKCLKLPGALGTALVETFVQRFRDESRLLYRLSQGNLNIVRSIAAGTTQAPSSGAILPYMVLEWLEGRSLSNDFQVRKATGHRGRSLPEILRLFEPAADGLAFAHSQGVVHRDLNPGNLFLVATPQGPRMKVLDFGVAKIMHDSALNLGPRMQTMGHIRIFAPAYGAPEQFDDRVGPIGAWSDVYAFALVILEALRDQPVNDGEHLGEFAQYALDYEHRPTPRALGVDVSDAVEKVFAGATRIETRERFPSAMAFWKALQAAVNEGEGEQTTRLREPTGKHAATARTMPLGSALPALGKPGPPRPSSGRVSSRPPAPPGARPITLRPRAPGTPPPPPPARTSVPSARLPAAPPVPPAPPSTTSNTSTTTQRPMPVMPPSMEEDDEVTCVRAPEPDFLKSLVPAPAAGMPASPPIPPPPRPFDAEALVEEAPISEPPGSGGTLIMAPGTIQGGPPSSDRGAPPPPAPDFALNKTFALGAQLPPMPAQAPPAPDPLKMTVPLGHPGLSPQAPPVSMGPPLAAPPGVSQLHNLPPQGQAPGPYMQNPGPYDPNAQHPPHGPRPSFAVAPTAPPPAKNPIVTVVVAAAAALLVLGGVGTALALKMRHAAHKAAASASVSAVPVVTSSPPAPTVPPVVEPPPVETAAAVETDAAAEPTDAGNDAGAPVDAGVATTATPEPTASANTANSATPPVWTPTTAAPSASAAVDPRAWNEGNARAKLSQSNAVLAFCKRDGGLTGRGSASVTFAGDGTVSQVALDPPFAGTKEGDCVSGQFRRAKVSPFDGGPKTVKHGFEIPN